MTTVMSYDEVPSRKGRDRIYPLHTMNVGEFFFLPGRDREAMASYISHQAKKLQRKFQARTLWMRFDRDRWVSARESEPGAQRGVAIYRTE